MSAASAVTNPRRSRMPGDAMNHAALGAIALGIVLALGAAAAALVSATLARRRIAELLISPDAATRISAIELASSQGLRRHARALVELSSREQDGAVLEALAHAVRRNLWEPADSRRVVLLRVWAEKHHGAVRERTTRPGPPAAAVRAGGSRRTVVVTGAGGPAGINVIRALTAAGHHVVAVDADKLAAGLYLAPRGYVVPPACHPAFVDRLLDVVQTSCAEALVPTVAEEMVVLDRHAERLQSCVAVWLPTADALETCVDKWRFAQVMETAGIRIPQTALGNAEGVPGPWVVKPRWGRGSRDVTFVDDAEALDAALRATPDPIVQTCLSGHEFTVDALIARDGEVAGAVPRWRLETKAGISTKGRTFSDEVLIDEVTAVLSAIGLRGAANVQGFVDDGAVTFVEVNPRFSGGLALSQAAGADLVGEYLRGVLGEPIRTERLRFRPGLTMTRHLQEIYA